jgi:hypothetical protein
MVILICSTQQSLMAFAEKTGAAPEHAQQLTPAQHELTQNLVRIQQDRQLSVEVRAQQTLSAVKSFVVQNPSEFTPQMAKGMAESLEAQVKYLEASRAKYSRDAVAGPFIQGSTVRQLGAGDASVISTNAAKVSDNFQKMLRFSTEAATYAGALANKSDEELGSKKAKYVESLYTNLSNMVDLGLENSAAYTEMAQAAGRSNARAEQEFRTGAAVTAGLALTVIGMGAGGVLTHAVGHAMTHALGHGTAATVLTATTATATSAAAGAATGIAADAAMIGIKEGRLITLGEMGSVAWKGAALGALAHIPITKLAELAHSKRAIATGAAATSGVALSIGSRMATAAEESALAVNRLATTVERGAQMSGTAAKLGKTGSHGLEEVDESHAKATAHAKKAVEDKFGE